MIMSSNHKEMLRVSHLKLTKQFSKLGEYVGSVELSDEKIKIIDEDVKEVATKEEYISYTKALHNAKKPKSQSTKNTPNNNTENSAAKVGSASSSKNKDIPKNAAKIRIPNRIEDLIHENDLEVFNEWLLSLDNIKEVETTIDSIPMNIKMIIKNALSKITGITITDIKEGMMYIKNNTNVDNINKLSNIIDEYLIDLSKNVISEKDFSDILNIMTENFNGSWNIIKTSMSTDKEYRTGFLVRNMDSTSLLIAPVYRKKKIVSLRVAIGGSVFTSVDDVIWGDFNIKDTTILPAIDEWMLGNSPFNIKNKTLVIK